MTDSPVAPSVIGGVALLERAIAYTRGSLQLVRPHLMDRPTPCRGWNLTQLLDHMNDSLIALQEAGDTGQLGLYVPEEPGPDDPVERLRTRACQLLGSWTKARPPDSVDVGDSTLLSSLLTGTGALEIAVHGWDVAQACGEDRPIPGALAEALLALAPLLVTADDRPERFGPPIPVAPDAGPGERLLALAGRRRD